MYDYSSCTICAEAIKNRTSYEIKKSWGKPYNRLTMRHGLEAKYFILDNEVSSTTVLHWPYDCAYVYIGT